MEAYEYWSRVLSLSRSQVGILGENIATESLNEVNVFVGDQYQFGTMVLEASQPRMPCFKLNLRLNRADAGKLFSESPAAGIYWKIVKDGEVALGDTISKLEPRCDIPAIAMKDLLPVMNKENPSKELLKRIINFPGMDPKIVELAISQV